MSCRVIWGHVFEGQDYKVSVCGGKWTFVLRNKYTRYESHVPFKTRVRRSGSQDQGQGQEPDGHVVVWKGLI